MSDDFTTPGGGSQPPHDDQGSDFEISGAPNPNAGGTPPPPPPPPLPPSGYQGAPDPSSYDYPLKPKRDDPRQYGGRGFTWQEVWMRAVTQPNVDTYSEHLYDPQMSMSRGLTWIFAAAVVGSVVQAVVTSMFGVNTFGESVAAGGAVGATLCCAPIFAAIGIVFFLVFNAIQYVVASLLGGEGSFEQQVYLVASYSAPLSLISALIGVIPILGGLIGLGLALYGLALNVLAMMAAHRFGAGKAIIASLGWLVLLCIGLCCILIIAGAAIGSVFEDIINELITPTPSLVFTIVRSWLGI